MWVGLLLKLIVSFSWGTELEEGLSLEELTSLKQSIDLQKCKGTKAEASALRFSEQGKNWMAAIEKGPLRTPAFPNLKSFNRQFSYFSVVQVLEKSTRDLVKSAKKAKQSEAQIEAQIDLLAGCQEQLEILVIYLAATHQMKRAGLTELTLNEKTLSDFLPPSLSKVILTPPQFLRPLRVDSGSPRPRSQRPSVR